MIGLTMSTNPHYLERQSRLESDAKNYPRKFPIAIKSAQGHPRLSQALQRACFGNQLIVERGGRHGAVLRPPLTLTHQEGDIVIERLEAALEVAPRVILPSTEHV